MSQASLITFTFIRHGESTDNLKQLWAGWRDAPLSNHGMAQANALGDFFATTRFSTIYTSDLSRAHTTASCLLSAQPAPQPPLTVSPLLREQHFGEGEGKRWAWGVDKNEKREEWYKRGVYPACEGRQEKFPGGESLEDLDRRADRAVEELLIPEIGSAMKEGMRGRMIAVVSHGLCISALVSAFMRHDRNGANNMGGRYRGLMNTAWIRVAVDVKGFADVPMSFDASSLPALTVRVTHVNEHSHIDSIKRQRGGIGSSAHDPKQQDIRAFFGGASLPAAATGHTQVEPPAHTTAATHDLDGAEGDGDGTEDGQVIAIAPALSNAADGHAALKGPDTHL